jgi:SprT-like family
MNREEWLNLASERFIRAHIARHGGAIKYKYRVSVGFPQGSRGGKSAESIGQCWPATRSEDGMHEIFISPKLEARAALETLLHEHIHASVGLEHKHGKPFKQLALAVGFVGKMRETPCGDELKERIGSWLKGLPDYPHGRLNTDAGKKEAKPGSRLIKAMCPDCGYTVRITQKWLDVGPPHCPEHGAMLAEGQDGDGDDDEA